MDTLSSTALAEYLAAYARQSATTSWADYFGAQAEVDALRAAWLAVKPTPVVDEGDIVGAQWAYAAGMAGNN